MMPANRAQRGGPHAADYDIVSPAQKVSAQPNDQYTAEYPSKMPAKITHLLVLMQNGDDAFNAHNIEQLVSTMLQNTGVALRIISRAPVAN